MRSPRLRASLSFAMALACLAAARVGGAQLPSASLGPFRWRTSDDLVQLHRVSEAHFLPDGGVVVADAGNRRVAILSPRGALVAQVARAGSGPGDVRSISRLFVAADTLLLYDATLERVSWFSRDARFLRSIQLPRVDDRFTRLVAFASADRFIAVSTASHLGSPTGLFDDRVRLLEIVGRRPPVTIGTETWSRSYHVVQEGGTTTYSTPFLGSAHFFATAGRHVLVPVGAAHLEVWAPGDATRRRVELPVARRPFDRALIDRHRDSLLRVINDPSSPSADRVRRVFGAEFPVPRDRPVVAGGATVGRTVWLRLVDTGNGATSDWLVLDVPTARLVARVSLPRTTRVVGGDDRRVLLIETDEFGVETLAVRDAPHIPATGAPR